MKKPARRQCLLRAAAALSLAAMLMPDDGRAGDTGGLEEIMVTARRFAEDVQKTPVAITALCADDIKHQSVHGRPRGRSDAGRRQLLTPGNDRVVNAPLQDKVAALRIAGGYCDATVTDATCSTGANLQRSCGPERSLHV